MNNSIQQPVPTLAPSFSVPWEGQTNSIGDYVILNANAVGTAPLSLQWYENGVPICSATNETLIQFYYNNTMTNSGTNVISVIALIRMVRPPTVRRTSLFCPIRRLN